MHDGDLVWARPLVFCQESSYRVRSAAVCLSPCPEPIFKQTMTNNTGMKITQHERQENSHKILTWDDHSTMIIKGSVLS